MPTGEVATSVTGIDAPSTKVPRSPAGFVQTGKLSATLKTKLRVVLSPSSSVARTVKLKLAFAVTRGVTPDTTPVSVLNERPESAKLPETIS